MKCLVTGGAGFIGSHIAEALVRRGDRVRVLDNLSMGSKNNLAGILHRIEFMEGDIRDRLDLRRAVWDIDVIFHEAALRSVPRSIDDPGASHEVNATGTMNLLLAARKAHVKRVVYASSSSAYGDQKDFPQRETAPVHPLSPYAVSKLAGELYGVIFANTFGVSTVSLRYFNVYGPRQHPESQYAAVIPIFMQSILQGKPLDIHSDGKQARDFTYVDNVVQANLLAAQKPRVSGEVFNVACGQSYSLLKLVSILEDLSGHPLKRRHHATRTGDVRKTWADISKAKRLLGYKPAIDFQEGLRRTWEWFQQR